jgi:hypothetical protein
MTGDPAVREHGPRARQSWWGVLFCIAVVALIACAASTRGVDTRGERGIPAARADIAGDGRSRSLESPPVRPCGVRHAVRTFVGFGDGMELDAFELAAYEAQRVSHMIDVRLCARAPALDRSGALHAALHARTLELFEIRFVRADASMARVGLRPIVAPSAVTSQAAAYTLTVTRQPDPEGWQLVSASVAQNVD